MPNAQERSRVRAALHQNQTPLDNAAHAALQRRKYTDLACSNAKLSAEYDMLSIESHKKDVNNAILKKMLNSANEDLLEAEHKVEMRDDQIAEITGLFDEHKVSSHKVLGEANGTTVKWMEYSAKLKKRIESESAVSTDLSEKIDVLKKEDEIRTHEYGHQLRKLDSMKKYTYQLEQQIRCLNSMDLGQSRSLMEEAMNAAAEHGKRIGDIMGRAKVCGLIDNEFLSRVLNKYKLTATDMENSITNISCIELRDPGSEKPGFPSQKSSTPKGGRAASAVQSESVTISSKSEKRCFEFEEHATVTLAIHDDSDDEENDEKNADEDDVAEPLLMPNEIKKTKLEKC